MVHRPFFAKAIRQWCALVVAMSASTSGWSQDRPLPLPPVSASAPSEYVESDLRSQAIYGTSSPNGKGAAARQNYVGQTVFPTSPLEPPMTDYGTSASYLKDYDDRYSVPKFYIPSSAPLPQYFFEPYYYQMPGLGVRSISDYAPPGYEARDYQDAPGVPEFTPITPPVPVTPEERQRFVTRGIVPGSFLAPGTNTSFRLRGFVRLAALYDFDPIGSTDSFATNTIPVPQQDGENFNMSGRISRFALESWTPTSFHEWNVHTFIEGDFFNGPPQAVGGGGNPFRLRHAFIDFGYFRFGQQNTVFMDGTNWPSLVDFQGPNSWVNQRQPSARVTLPLLDTVYWAASVERPFTDITTHGLGTPVQDIPDFATHLRYEGLRGHAQVSGLVRSIGYQPTGDDVTRLTGAGMSTSVVFHPWAILCGTDPVREANPSGLTRTRILMQSTWGYGISRYINDLAGQGMDAQVNPVTGVLDKVEVLAWNASYEHWFCERWLSNTTYSQVLPRNTADQLGTSYDKTQYLATSIWWLPVPRMSIGVEYMWGERTNLDNDSGEANRVHGIVQYNF